MRLHLQVPVTCGSTVEISDGDDPVLGTVCSCAPDGETYVIGVRVTHDQVLAG